MQIENGQPVFLDKYGLVELGKDGEPKTLAEKMAEVNETSAFKHCFSGGTAGNQADNSQAPQTYTREQAIKGKVNINDIASGRIQMKGVDSQRKPDSKVASASEVAKLKGRRWK